MAITQGGDKESPAESVVEKWQQEDMMVIISLRNVKYNLSLEENMR